MTNQKLKCELVEMMKFFHLFCNENDLTYYALGGTMLGAMRHHGFIPWDDDIDIGMPRADYEKLEDLMTNQSNHKYVLETQNSNSKDYYYPFQNSIIQKQRLLKILDLK